MPSSWALGITATVIGIIGLPMIWLGGELALVGGTPYYLGTGILMSLSAAAKSDATAPVRL